MELEALQAVHADVLALGAALVAVSPQVQHYGRQTVGKHRLSFPVLSDPDNVVASRFGLIFTLPEELRALYLGFGIDLVRCNGNQSWTLPLAGRFIIDRTRTIRGVEVHADHTQRPEPTELLTLQQSLR